MNTDRIEELVRHVQALPDPAARNAALELVQAVMDFHAGGLERMMQVVSDADSSGRVKQALGADELVSSILLLHDLHPLDLQARVARALDQTAFQSRGAKVELLSTDGGIVRVQIEGGLGLRAAVEKALANAAPDAEHIALEGAGGQIPAADFVPLEQLLAT